MSGMQHALVWLSFLLVLAPMTLQAKTWRGIVPLKSTRADVERILGLPGKHGRYQFEKERASIQYAGGGSCCPVNGCICFVSDETVLSVFVELEIEMKFSALKVAKARFKKHTSRNPNLASYSDDEAGVIYTVDQERDEVTTIEYLPSRKDCKKIMKTKPVPHPVECRE